MALDTTTHLNSAAISPALVRYPRDLGTAPYEKWMLFEVKSGRHILRQSVVGVGNNPDSTIKAVALYLPADALHSEMAVNWKEDEYGTKLGAAVAGALQTGVNGTAGNLFTKAPTTLASLSENLPQLKESIVGGISGLIKSFAAEIGNQEIGKIGVGETQLGGLLGGKPNPRTDIFFDTVSYREHTFSFTLIPRNKQEADDIDQILNVFQFYMLPTFGNNTKDNAYFIGYPYEFEISMFTEYTGKHHINSIDRSVLTNVSISHASGSRVAFVDDAGREEYYPASTTLSLRFKEVRLQGRNAQNVIWRGAGSGNGKPTDPGRTAYPDDSIYSSESVLKP